VATGGAIWFTLLGCVSQDAADTVNQRLNDGMSTSELAIANRVARATAQHEGASVTATATVSGTPAPESAGGDTVPCASGRLIHITLVGQFPDQPHRNGSTPILHQELTVDGTTGRVCQAHFANGPIVPDPSSVRLFSR